MRTPFKLKKSPLELWPWGKRAKAHRKLKKWKKGLADKKASETSDEDLMDSYNKNR